MASSARKAKIHDAQRAHRLRQRRADGKSLAAVDRQFLERYERDHPPPLRDQPSSNGETYGNRVDRIAAIVDVVAKESDQRSAISDHVIADDQPAITPPPVAEPPSDQAPPPIPAIAKPASDHGRSPDRTVIAIDGAAIAYCNWLKGAQPKLAADGWPALPDELVDALVLPSAKRLEARAAKYLAEKGLDPEKSDPWIVALPGAEIGLHRFLTRKRTPSPPMTAAPTSTRPAPREEEQKPAAPPSPTPPPPEPAPEPERPASSRFAIG
jgi:hypothetical protein